MAGMIPGLEVQLYTVDNSECFDERSWWVEEDFANGSIYRVLSDMTDPKLFETYQAELVEADLILLDGPHNFVTEHETLQLIDKVKFKSPPILVVDDIRLITEMSAWWAIKHPKMDFTSYGHFTGTGLVDWS